MTTFKLKRLSGVGSRTKGGDRLKGDPNLLGRLSFPDGNYLVATPLGYDSMKLQFLVPSVFLGYTRLAVVRGSYGYPINKHDGVTVFEYPNTATPTTQTFIDTNFGQGLVQGQAYYYTLFAKMPNSIPNWNQVDTDAAVVTKDLGSSDRLWGKLPAFYRDADANTLQRQLVYTNGGQLRRFIDLLGYEEDMLRTTLETLMWVNDPVLMHASLLYLQGYDLSLANGEASIGDARYRSLVDDAVSIRKTKGTPAGLAAYVHALSDYNIRLLARRNLYNSSVQARFQDPNNFAMPTASPGPLVTPLPTTDPTIVGGSSSFAGDKGYATWASVPTTDPSTNGYSKSDWSYKVPYVFNAGGVCVITSITNLTVDANGVILTNGSVPIPANILKFGVPLPTPGVSYTYSAIATNAQANNTASGTMQIRFVWYDNTGTWISSTTQAISGAAAFNKATPSQFWASATAPAGAAFCDPQIIFANPTATFQIWFGGQQFELTSGFNGTYIDPHTAEIQLIAQRVNLVINPSAEVDNSNWQGTNMSTLLSQANAAATAGAKVFQITCSASANPTMTTGPAFMPINAALLYSLRFNAQVTNASIGCNAIITWYDGAATPNVIRTDTLNFPAPLPTSVMREFIFGNVVPPAGAVNAKVGIQFTGTSNTNVILVDSVLFGPGAPLWYFDGDTQDGLDTPASVTPTAFSDFQWGGTQGKSVSYYYNNFYIVQKRLTTDLPNWLPYGTPFSLLTLVAP